MTNIYHQFCFFSSPFLCNRVVLQDEMANCAINSFNYKEKCVYTSLLKYKNGLQKILYSMFLLNLYFTSKFIVGPFNRKMTPSSLSFHFAKTNNSSLGI